MFSKKSGILFILLVNLFFSQQVFAQNNSSDKEKQETLQKGIELLRRYFNEKNEWQATRPEIKEDVNALLHFIEDKPIDTVLVEINQVSSDSVLNLVYRLPENVPDSLNLPGFYSTEKLEKAVEKIGLNLQAEYQEKEITVPLSLISNLEEKVNLVDSAEVNQLFTDSVLVLPDSLQPYDVIPDSLLDSAQGFQRLLKLDSIRKAYIEQVRLQYNDSLIKAYRDSVIQQYAQEQFEEEYRTKTNRLIDSVRLNNYQVLRNYNDSVVGAVNDSILLVLNELVQYADYIDTTKLNMVNIFNDKSSLLLGNDQTNYTRFWLKNEQNDSLSVLMKNLNKKTIQMSIDNGITFNRFKARETKGFDFSTLTNNVSGLTNVGKRYEVKTPWRIGGDGNIGFTQTYVENWKKGGKSALSFLMVLKGFANYSSSNGKIKWENSGEIRNGWIRQGGEISETQKNDDKFEITSRFGVSAFKKWYYSAEFNYETQLFNGYRYPRSENPEPISAFMAPARTFFKLGLDYKPNKNFSLLLSPLTLKNVYVRDTVKIDQTNFSIDADKKSFWEPGLNADIKYRRELTDDILYETKYKMFINYNEPFSKYDINWENQLVMKVNNHINFRLMVHLIYDDDVKFPVYDVYGNDTGEKKPKLQIKELITIGFSYQISRRVTRTRRMP